MTIQPEHPAPPPLTFASSYKRKGFLMTHSWPSNESIGRHTELFSCCCFSCDVTADVTRKCALAFWKQIVWFLITLSCEHTDLIRPWFLFLSTPPNLPDAPGFSQAFSWKDYRCVQLPTMHFGGKFHIHTKHVEDNPKKLFLVEFF